MNKVRKIIKKFIPKKYPKVVIEWKNLIFEGYAPKLYSQEGEDMILSYIFMQKGQQVFMWMLELTIQNAFQILIFSIKRGREV